MRLPYAEDLNYWKTSRSGAGDWIAKTEKLIADFGGTVYMSAKGRGFEGRMGYMIEFAFGDDRFRLVWPILPIRSGYAKDEPAAERQAATMIYHDVKSRAMRHAIFGARVAFFEFLLLEDGRIAAQLAPDEMISGMLPAAFGPKLIEGAK